MPVDSSPRSRFGDTAFVLFALVQMADGWLTYLGIRAFGPAIEANPIILWGTATFGVAAALTGAKTVAVIGGVILHVFAQHGAVAILTIAYLVAAIGPWTLILWR